MGVAYEISRDVFKTVFCSGRKHGCGLPAAARQARPGGGSTERFYLFIFFGGHPSAQPLHLCALGTGPPFQQAPPGTSWAPREDEEERETHSSWEKKKRRKCKDNVECGRERPERARREGGYRDRRKWEGQSEGEEMGRKKRTELMEEETTAEERERRRVVPPRRSISLGS